MDKPSGFLQHFIRWGKLIHIKRVFAVTLLGGAIVSGLATYGTLSGEPPFGPDPKTVLVLLNLNLIFLLLLGALVARRVVGIWTERRKGPAGSRLHIRLVVLFSLVSVTPAILVAVFSAVFFNLGIQSWFNERVRTALEESTAVAESYLHEHQQTIRADILAMANDLNRSAQQQLMNPAHFNHIVGTQAALRSLTEALVFDGNGQILARSGLTFVLEFETVAGWALEKARAGEVVLFISQDDDRVRALVQLDSFLDVFLYVGRYVDNRVLSRIERTEGAVSEYTQLEQERSRLQITFTLIFVAVALLLLLAAIWVGLNFASRLARPIGNLVEAAERVRSGDLSSRVEEGIVEDEIGTLSRAFNRMTGQLESQRRELVEANRRLDERMRFIEAVLAGVKAGIIGLDKEGCIDHVNHSASVLLSLNLDKEIGRDLGEVVPEMAELLEAARSKPEGLVQSQIALVCDNHRRTLFVRITAERGGARGGGFVVTFDDITELQSAQRKAAWADVARRIAHEIRNPLTPIQLSAERLQRKYMKEIKSDPETFRNCTETIIRQVGDIGKMVDEFSSFARMPAPLMGPADIADICRMAIFLQDNADPNVKFHKYIPDHPVNLLCDARQVSQAITNLLKNAVEAIGERTASDAQTLPPGEISLRIVEENEHIIVEVEDNGRGLPGDLRDRLTEPYVTTREKGTGLGLAIVHKIMEDHGGELKIEDRAEGGARVSLVFPKINDAAEGDEGASGTAPSAQKEEAAARG
jgi:two-component system nitrogen regulation sensor histidine kinase NtrY